jgi:5'-phosphate synthase pdxT subunit
VRRNYFGRQLQSFQAELDLPFLGEGKTFKAMFIRAPVVETLLEPTEGAHVDEERRGEDTVVAPSRTVEHGKEGVVGVKVEVMGRLGRSAAGKAVVEGGRQEEEEADIVAVRQGNAFGTSFHPELGDDERIHVWWLGEVVKTLKAG